MAIVEYEVETEVLTEREQRARTLEAAALEIEVRGWTRNYHCDKDGRVCVLGALAFASGVNVQNGDLFLTGAEARIDERNRAQFRCDPMEWNDEEAQSGEEAAFLLRWRAEEIRDGWDA